MPSTKVLWLIVSPLIAVNLFWFYRTATAWSGDRNRDGMILMGVQLGITLILGAIPILRAYADDRQFKAKRKRQARSNRVAWQASKLEDLSE